ncbi:hypothetical protein [Mycobacterium sp. DL592]|uniref:hypothetical protein n=1 Tax=Mycobacterium sp. DL592 TaxID=2675524 RepID=UPI0014203764|nr:hypothetical protein [Mycobacterium sp. DL592]
MSGLAEWAEAIVPHVVAPDAIVLIDGRSGAGKTTLAREVCDRAALQGVSVQLIHVEDIYPGWGGLADAVQIVAAQIVGPLAAGRNAQWQSYDWDRGAPGPLRHAHSGQPVLIEGVGALSKDSAAHASWRVWMEAPTGLRRSRALARDGDLYRPHWTQWADAETGFINLHQPAKLADIIITTKESP